MNAEQQAYLCGCVRGQYLCPEAERLWRRTGDAYAVAKSTGRWAEYYQAQRDYKAHFGWSLE